jgi:hypothetical protein
MAIFLNSGTEEYIIVIFLGTEEYKIIEECTMFSYSECMNESLSFIKNYLELHMAQA